jgi:hypothetical protein
MNFTRDSFLKAASRLKTQEVKLEGGTVFVRELTESETVEFVRLPEDGRIEFLLLHCLCDEDGDALLRSDDLEAIKRMGATTANAIVQGALEVSGMAEKPVKKK